MSEALRKNYSQLFNGYSLPGWKLDYGKLERMVSEADAELTALRAENERLRKLLREALEDWYYDMPNPSDEAIQTKAAIDAAMKEERT